MPSQTSTGLTELDRSRRHGIGLCLSGGGYRAALYHLGALRRLAELGILGQVRTVSSVSGGSILAAFMADRIAGGLAPALSAMSGEEFERTIAGPFRSIPSRDIRTGPILRSLLPWFWFRTGYRSEALAKQYHKHLTQRRLSEIAETPHFIFCATDIVFAINWEISRKEVGGYLPGYITPHPDWPVSFAVAVSSCFPPVFDPVPIREEASRFERGKAAEDPDFERHLADLRLTDGGVYDNLGVEPIWKEHEYVLVSDGGSPFAFQSSGWFIGRIKRVIDVQGVQAAKLRARWLIANFETGIHRGTYWSLETENEGKGHAGYSNRLVRDYISRVRTDLNRFTPPEMDILENHGYMTASRKLRKYVPELVAADSPSPRWPNLSWCDEAAVRRALVHSHRRYSWRRLLRVGEKQL